MARPRVFDPDSAFEAATGLFWRRGYGATSLDDLLADMSISRSSFYSTFSSKEALFRDVLKAYGERSERQLRRIREREAGLQAIQEFLNATLLGATRHERLKGCLLVNSILELEGVEPELHALASSQMSRLRTAFAELLDEARSLGALREPFEPEPLAEVLLSFVKGLRVSARQGESAAQLKRQVSTMLELISAEENYL